MVEIVKKKKQASEMQIQWISLDFWQINLMCELFTFSDRIENNVHTKNHNFPTKNYWIDQNWLIWVNALNFSMSWSCPDLKNSLNFW